MSTLTIYPTIEQEKVVKAFLEALDISFVATEEVLPPHVLQGIAKGQQDIKKGNTITFEEFKCLV